MSTELSNPGANPPRPEPPALRPSAPSTSSAEQADGGAPFRARWPDWRACAIILLLAGFSVPIWRMATGKADANAATAATSAVQRVAVAQITREDLFNEVTIPAEFRPYLKVELHAKVSGYVDKINVDIGDRVKAGQLLARLEVPELRDELARATAAEQRAEADYKDAHLAYTRLVAVNKTHPNLVAQQELDAAEAKNTTTEATIAGAKAEVQRDQTLLGYTQIIAPFDGVITHRYADPGSLIQAGTASDTQSMPLVCLSDNYRLRLDFPVSVAYVQDIKVGDQVEVRVESLKGKPFKGTISRSTQKVDEDTRTMITEIEVPNPNLELMPGMYATVLLKVERRPQVLTIPTEAISSDKKASVYLVNADQQIEERPVTLGLETAGKYEVVAGLKEGDLVMIGNRSQVKPGQKVETKLIDSLAQE